MAKSVAFTDPSRLLSPYATYLIITAEPESTYPKADRNAGSVCAAELLIPAPSQLPELKPVARSVRMAGAGDEPEYDTMRELLFRSNFAPGETLSELTEL